MTFKKTKNILITHWFAGNVVGRRAERHADEPTPVIDNDRPK